MLDQTARTAAVAVFLACAVPCAKADEPVVSSSGQEILVLRNGEIFEGKITRANDVYVVDRPGAQIRLPQADVEMVCANLQEAYQRKRATIQIGNVHHHLELAQWCLRYKLHGQAAVELADATVSDPKNPMIEALQHRLKLAIEPPRPSETTATAAGPSTEELDRMTRGLPRGFVETFTQSVQPVLLNNCANAGCHGPQSETGLKLFRVSSNKPSSRRVTQRNLYSVLRFVDSSNPSASPLLTAASSPHGPARYAVLGEHQASQYQRLVDWANQIGREAATESPASAAPAARIAESAFGAPPVLSAQEAKKARLMTAADPRRGDCRAGYGASSLKKKPADAAPASYDEPIDPLDPEVFNRRYAPGASAPATIAPATAAPEKKK